MSRSKTKEVLLAEIREAHKILSKARIRTHFFADEAPPWGKELSLLDRIKELVERENAGNAL